MFASGRSATERWGELRQATEFFFAGAMSVGTRSTQGLFAHRPVAALPTTTDVLMLSVHVGRAALASNLVRQLKNLTFLMRRKRNLPPRIGVVQDIGRALDELVYPQPERNTS